MSQWFHSDVISSVWVVRDVWSGAETFVELWWLRTEPPPSAVRWGWKMILSSGSWSRTYQLKCLFFHTVFCSLNLTTDWTLDPRLCCFVYPAFTLLAALLLVINEALHSFKKHIASEYNPTSNYVSFRMYQLLRFGLYRNVISRRRSRLWSRTPQHNRKQSYFRNHPRGSGAGSKGWREVITFLLLYTLN